MIRSNDAETTPAPRSAATSPYALRTAPTHSEPKDTRNRGRTCRSAPVLRGGAFRIVATSITTASVTPASSSPAATTSPKLAMGAPIPADSSGWVIPRSASPATINHSATPAIRGHRRGTPANRGKKWNATPRTIRPIQPKSCTCPCAWLAAIHHRPVPSPSHRATNSPAPRAKPPLSASAIDAATNGGQIASGPETGSLVVVCGCCVTTGCGPLTD